MIRSRLAAFAVGIGADGITLWIARGAELVALCNPLEPEIIGLRQSLNRGIISQAYLTGMGIIEHVPGTNPNFDTTVDHLVGKQTHEIMAVPVNMGEERDGVISAVKHAKSGSSGFSADDLVAMERLASEVSSFQAG